MPCDDYAETILDLLDEDLCEHGIEFDDDCGYCGIFEGMDDE